MKYTLKYILLLSLLLSVGLSVSAVQDETALLLPRPEEIGRVTISSNSMKSWFTKETLLEILPRLTPVEGTYTTKLPLQRGTLELRNGTTLHWMAATRSSLLLYSETGEKLYLLAAEEDEIELFPILVKRKIGYIDVNGRVVIEPRFETRDVNGRFDEEQYFKDGLAIVSEEGRGGFIDKTGRFVIVGPYYPRGHFSSGLAQVSDHKNYDPYKIGFMDRTGKFVIPPQFDRAEDFSEGLAVVQVHDKWGYIDRTGQMIIPARFDDAASFRDGFALVNINGVRRGFINKTGGFLQMPDEVEKFGSLAEGLIAVKVKNRWGFINTTGQVVIEPQFEPAIGEYGDDVYYGLFKDGLALARSGGKWGYINKSGKFAIPPRFDKAKPFEGSLAAVYLDGKWGLIDRSGQFVASPKFERIGSFAEGLAAVSLDGRQFGFIDSGGRMVIAPRFTGATGFSEGLASVQVAVQAGRKVDYLWGYIDKSGKFVIPPQFISQGVFDGGLARQTISEFMGIPAPSPGFHDEWGYINRAGKYVWKSTN